MKTLYIIPKQLIWKQLHSYLPIKQKGIDLDTLI